MIQQFLFRARHAAAFGVLLTVTAHDVGAQLPVTRAEAERAALATGARVALARADSAAARAVLVTARAFPNPTFGATRSVAPPTSHLTLDLPFDAPWTRGPRIGAANAAGRVARLRFLSERVGTLLEVDTTYTRALAAQARVRLSRQTARDADSLRKMTVSRREAGDASDLDVDLATVTAGQQLNVASADSLTYMSLLLTVQTLMGIPADSVAIVLADSLTLSAASAAAPAAVKSDSGMVFFGTSMLSTIPRVAAAEAFVQAAELAVTREHRSVWGVPSLQVGVEWGDPANEPKNKALPLIGISLPLPILNRNQGPIAQAVAERDRARAELSVARLEARQRLVEGLRKRTSLHVQVARDQDLVVRAERVAAKSLTAYREGASALPAVLEARRIAREVLGQYIDDLTALLTVEAELRALTQTVLPQ